MRLGVLDIGSNTIHSLVVDAHHGAAPIPAHKFKKELRLSQYADEKGFISQPAIDSLVEFIIQSQQIAEDLGVERTIAFATSAIRDAPNRDSLVTEIEQRTSIHVDLLSGETEAELTFLAARRWVGWSAGRLMLLDIGGGSLEIAIGDDEEPDIAVSVPIGAGVMTRQFITSDPAEADDIRALRKHVRAQIASVAGSVLKGASPRVVVGTSKTFKQLARIAGAAESGAGIYIDRQLSREDLMAIVGELTPMTDSERRKISGVSAGRSPQMLAGALVAQAALDLLNVDTVHIGPWALREGVILRTLDSM